MSDVDSGKRTIWEGGGPVQATDLPRPELVLMGREQERLWGERLFQEESLSLKPRRGMRHQPFTPPWFLELEKARFGKYGRWLPRLLEFSKHPGEVVLTLGCELGSDWVQYAQHGARVLACSSSTLHLELIRRNFAFRSLQASFLHAAPTSLPVEDASIDVACLNNMEGEKDWAAVVDEVYRVLKPGGKVLAVFPAHYRLEFWLHQVLPWFRGSVDGSSPRQRFSARELRRLFSSFEEARVHKRHLRRSEVPHLYRILPLPLLERLVGRYLVFKAFKPVRSACVPPLPRVA
jgi:SAM-dependent methyltransferase